MNCIVMRSSSTRRTHNLRAFLAERDGLVCHWCPKKLQMTKRIGPNGKLADDFATLDHLIREVDGGKLNRANTVLACKKCNSSRHHKKGGVYAKQNVYIDINSPIGPETRKKMIGTK